MKVCDNTTKFKPGHLYKYLGIGPSFGDINICARINENDLRLIDIKNGNRWSTDNLLGPTSSSEWGDVSDNYCLVKVK